MGQVAEYGLDPKPDKAGSLNIPKDSHRRVKLGFQSRDTSTSVGEDGSRLDLHGFSLIGSLCTLICKWRRLRTSVEIVLKRLGE